MSRLTAVLVVVLAVAGGACGDQADEDPGTREVELESGLRYEELQEGTGEEAARGDVAFVH